MGLVWSGMDIDQLNFRLLAIAEDIEIEARQILDDISLETVADMRRIIAAAETETGRERAASGEGLGQPGRIDTSAMISDVTFALDNDMSGEVVLTWGWTDHLEDYYLIQEHGNARREDCCGKCPPIAGGGYDCTCAGNPRCGGKS